jgi:1,3-beta-galactosyl-N-acetylhexosamine phosphorylase
VAYRKAVSAYLQDHPPQAEPVIGGLFPHIKQYPAQTLEILKRLHFNQLYNTLRNDLQAEGFKTFITRAPCHMGKSLTKKNPNWATKRYYWTAPAKASASGPLTIDLQKTTAGRHRVIYTHADPKIYWRVYDRTAGETVPAEQWNLDAEKLTVTLDQPQAGHVYRVAFLARAGRREGAKGFFKAAYPEPMIPQVAKAMPRIVRNNLKTPFGDVDVWRATTIHYPFAMDYNLHNWYGYQWGAGPAVQKAFTKATGKEFDPAWLIDDGRFGVVDYPPTQQYLDWMAFRMQALTPIWKSEVAASHELGKPVRVFWGDYWIGMEPYSDFLTETNTDAIVKACADSIVVRMITDIPAEIGKVMRYFWFSDKNIATPKETAGDILAWWTDMRRAVLFRCPDGLTWGGKWQPFVKAMSIPPLARAVGKVTDEFRLAHSLLNGKKAFTHPTTVYVVNAWGPLRSWAVWTNWMYPSTKFQRHLTDLPVNVRFVSIKEIAASGVPSDADVLINCGEPGSAWSGGHWWADGKAAAAIRTFVNNGGGLIGIEAPSYHPGEKTAWRLADLLGVDQAGYTSKAAEAGLFSMFDVRRTQGMDSSETPADYRATLEPTDAAHWITAGPAQLTQPKVRTTVKTKPLAEDLAVLYTGPAESGLMATARQLGKGRCVYLPGVNDRGDAYSVLLRRAIFWAAGQEKLHDRLVAEAPAVNVYAYPSESLLIVANRNGSTDTIVRFDPAIWNEDIASFRLVDVLTGQAGPVLTAQAARDGVKVSLRRREVRYYRLVPVEEE